MDLLNLLMPLSSTPPSPSLTLNSSTLTTSSSSSLDSPPISLTMSELQSQQQQPSPLSLPLLILRILLPALSFAFFLVPIGKTIFDQLEIHSSGSVVDNNNGSSAPSSSNAPQGSSSSQRSSSATLIGGSAGPSYSTSGSGGGGGVNFLKSAILRRQSISNNNNRNDSSEEEETSDLLTEPGFIPITIPLSLPRHFLSISLLSMISLSFLLSGIVLIVHAVLPLKEGDNNNNDFNRKHGEWEPDDSSGIWKGEAWYELAGLGVWALWGVWMASRAEKALKDEKRRIRKQEEVVNETAGAGGNEDDEEENDEEEEEENEEGGTKKKENAIAWKGKGPLRGVQEWKKRYVRLMVLWNWAGEIAIAVLVGIGIFGEARSRSPFYISHFAVSLFRVLLITVLLLALYSPKTVFVPYALLHPEEARARARAAANGYGTFGRQGGSSNDSEDGQGADGKKATLERTLVTRPPPPPPATLPALLSKVKVLYPYLWPKKSKILQLVAVACFLILLLGRAVNFAVPEMVGNVVEDLERKRSPWIHLLVYAGLRFCQGGQGLLSFAQVTLWIPVSQYSEREMSLMSFNHLLNLSMSYHTRRKTGEVLRILDRGSAINGFFQMLIFQLMPIVLDIFVAVGYLAWKFDALLAILILVVMFAYIWVSVKLTQRRVNLRRAMNDADKHARAIHTDTLISWEVVKYFTAEAFETARYGDAMRRYQKAEFHVTFSLQTLNLSQNFIISLGLLAGCLAVAFRVTSRRSSPSDFVRFITYLNQLYGPLGALGTLYRVVQQNLVDTENLIKLLQEPQDIQDKPGAQDIPLGGEITFENVTFSYDGKVDALKNISFTIPKGKSVALVGETGSGKSSILRLLYRFYDVTDGSIKIDGVDIRDLSQNCLRRQIGVVPQDSVLFNESIHYNIGYGDPAASEEDIRHAAQVAKIHDRIINFPDGYGTVVGERGVRLSGGEKQRVSIARTVLKDPPMIVFDEATSALDTHTERSIQAALRTLSEGRTTISIAHRLSTIVDCDLILVIKDGQLKEQGAHQELLEQGGLYADLWEKQVHSEAEIAAEQERKAREREGESSTPPEVVDRSRKPPGHP